MDRNVAIVFTRKGVNTLLAEGGTSAWRLDRNHARECEFAVCTRNGKHIKSEGTEPHQSAFMVGKVKDVVPAANRDRGRFLIQFSEYALVSVPDVWKGDRNPIKYAESLQEFGIDPAKLTWKPMPAQQQAAVPTTPASSSAAIEPLTIPQAKEGLSLMFNVPTEAIDITIRG